MRPFKTKAGSKVRRRLDPEHVPLEVRIAEVCVMAPELIVKLDGQAIEHFALLRAIAERGTERPLDLTQAVVVVAPDHFGLRAEVKVVCQIVRHIRAESDFLKKPSRQDDRRLVANAKAGVDAS